MIRRLIAISAVAAVTAAAGCRSDPSSPHTLDSAPASTIRLISPAGPSGVDPNAPLTFEFRHPMMQRMEMDLVLHRGDADGPSVPVTTAWRDDRARVTMTPAAPLAAKTTYTVEFRCPVASDASMTSGICPHAGSGSGMMHGGRQGAMPGGMHGSSGGMHGGGAGSGAHRMTFTFTTA